MSKVGTDSLQIRDFSDREILATLNDLGGKASAGEAANRIFGPSGDEEAHYARCVMSRFVWMRRYGLLDRDEDGDWIISTQGDRLRRGTVSATVASGIDRLGEDNALDLGHIVGVKLVETGEIAGRAMQRELVHQINRRKARLKGW